MKLSWFLFLLIRFSVGFSIFCYRLHVQHELELMGEVVALLTTVVQCLEVMQSLACFPFETED